MTRVVLALLIAALSADVLARPPAVIIDDEPSVNRVEADRGLHPVHRFFRNGGALERFTAMPGSWYALAEVDATHTGTYELIVERAPGDAQLRVIALDGDPFATATDGQPIHARPLLLQGARNAPINSGRRVRYRVQLPAALPPLLLFEWHDAVDQERPPLLFVDIRSRRVAQIGRGRPLPLPPY